MNRRRSAWKPSAASKKFLEAIQSAVQLTEGTRDRRNVLVFCGAGFSRAWSVRSPLSKDLFSIPTQAFEHSESLLRLLEYVRIGESGHLSQVAMQELGTYLNLCEEHRFLRGNLMDRYSPGRLKADLANAIKEYFRKIHYINYLNLHSELLPVKSKKSPHRKPIIRFLGELLHDLCEHTPDHAGLDLCFVTTNYDFFVESWIQESAGEPVLGNVYRGFTPSHINGEENSQYLMDRPYSLKLLKLNGGFEVIESPTGYAIDYRDHFLNPVMMLPSSFQDYGAEYFRCVFEKAATAFRRADVVLFVGYSFPTEDVLIRRLISAVGEDQRLGTKKYVISINSKGTGIIRRDGSEFIWAGGVFGD